MTGARLRHAGLAAALLLTAAASPAHAAPPPVLLTGNDLQERCAETATSNPVQWGVCLGYVMGVAELLSQGTIRPRACFAADVIPGQMADVVRQWLDRNPARRHLPAAALVATALQQGFPCR
jgi:hypothetical protein